MLAQAARLAGHDARASLTATATFVAILAQAARLAGQDAGHLRSLNFREDDYSFAPPVLAQKQRGLRKNVSKVRLDS